MCQRPPRPSRAPCPSDFAPDSPVSPSARPLAVAQGLTGRVVDAVTQEALPGANVAVLGPDEAVLGGAATEPDGSFRLAALAPGTYRVQASFVGYDPQVRTDVVVQSSRPTFLLFELREASLGEVVVQAGFFDEAPDAPVSVQSLGPEEIRRTPGGQNDISRSLLALPGVASGVDVRNDLLVRGGGPSENAYFVDGIEIPQINHFATQGASGGALGLLNVDFIREATFYTGGFPVRYGDAASSVLVVENRPGSPETARGRLHGRRDRGGALARRVVGAGFQLDVLRPPLLPPIAVSSPRPPDPPGVLGLPEPRRVEPEAAGPARLFRPLGHRRLRPRPARRPGGFRGDRDSVARARQRSARATRRASRGVGSCPAGSSRRPSAGAIRTSPSPTATRPAMRSSRTTPRRPRGGSAPTATSASATPSRSASAAGRRARRSRRRSSSAPRPPPRSTTTSGSRRTSACGKGSATPNSPRARSATASPSPPASAPTRPTSSTRRPSSRPASARRSP